MGWGLLLVGATSRGAKLTAALLLTSLSARAHADRPCDTPLAVLTSLQNQVDIRPDVDAAWHRAALNEPLCGGYEIRTGELSRAQVRLQQNVPDSDRDGTLMQMNQRSSLVLPKAAEPWWVNLVQGAIHILTRTPKRLAIKTLFCNANVAGTEFLVQAGTDQTRVAVYAGKVRVSNDLGSMQLGPGEAASAERDRAPRREILIRPRDAVQWALYYPPIIDTRAAPAGPNQAVYRRVLDLYEQAQITAAITTLDEVPTRQREPYYHVLRSALYLSVGQVDPAREDLATAIKLQSADATAYALESIIALTQNQKAQALSQAQRAIDADRTAASAWIADSYARQANFQLEAALHSARQATLLNPDNALAWARVAELELARGALQQADQAADRARTLNPGLARTQTISGFAALSRIQNAKALSVFTAAIQRDPADPLPRLGLGLAKIRTGQLAEGRRDIEDAANLDPDNALVRSYLGKAYYEEKRSDLAGKELDYAKVLDPKDPTPWFYDAIRKQTENRPVEALHDLQQAIARNENRAVYRSSLLIDEDRAARGTTLARTFDNLGFKRRAVIESTRSLADNPADYSAHRFLSDSYAGTSRHEIARVSELLQAQLLQPLNIQPVQPQLSVPGAELINLRLGPAQSAFNDFTALFERNRPRLLASGLAGSHDTVGDEVVLSGLHERLSYSFGQSHFQGNGYRPNNDNAGNVYDAFVQAQISDSVNAQIEYRYRDATIGDLTRRLNPDADYRLRGTLDQHIARAGLHISPHPNHHLLGSLIFTSSKELQDQFLSSSIRRIKDKRDALNGEGQYLFLNPLVDMVVGGGAYRIDKTKQKLNLLAADACLLTPQDCGTTVDEADNPTHSSISQHNAYIYSHWKLLSRITATAGLSYESYEDPSVRGAEHLARLNPKLGVQWQVSQGFRLRAAYFQTLKRQLVVDQTIEPTQIAGFNQFYDDFNGSHAELFGIGADFQPLDTLYFGLEFSRRNLTWTTHDNGNEKLFRAYLHWAAFDNWALNAEVQHEETAQEQARAFTSTLDSTILPVSLRYFSPNGFFSELGTIAVWQAGHNLDGTRDTVATPAEAFVVANAAIGYRLPQRLGILSLEVRNLFDESFRLQDLSFKTSDKFNVSQTLLPDRTFIARVTLSF